GASMDSPESDGRTLRLGYEAKNIAKNIKNLEFDIYRSEVDHIMDNYTFRSTTPSANRMESPTNVETRGAKLKLTSKMGETTLDYGIQFESLDKDAIVYNVTNYLANPMAYTDSWPDALQETRSVFAESTTPLTNEQKLIAGLRYDSVTHEIDRTNKAVTIYTNTYADYSGTTKKDDSNLNGLLRLESKLGGLDSYVALSRTHRYPDATELFVAMGGKWIGNPDLKPEQHNQLDFGLAQNQGATTWSVNAYYDSVSDYVLRDLAINQDASLLNNGASIYVNKDAVIYGLNGAIKKQLNQDISLGMNASLTQGENTTDNRTLSNIAPLSGSAYGEYSKSNWLAGARFNFATEQTDTNELFNELETPAWSSVDLYGEYQINKTFALNAGVDNLFDHAYYTYFNRTDATTGADYKVYEPGRIVWAKLNAKF
ncbi:MAG: TonB-dependent receptor, partial [Pseudomonadota bacterium]|nr:TonB-dependent receptor [Pseudomonadota bacterium]